MSEAESREPVARAEAYTPAPSPPLRHSPLALPGSKGGHSNHKGSLLMAGPWSRKLRALLQRHLVLSLSCAVLISPHFPWPLGRGWGHGVGSSRREGPGSLDI